MTTNFDIKKIFEEKASLLRSNKTLKLNNPIPFEFFGLNP